jgi:hypothetical protein
LNPPKDSSLLASSALPLGDLLGLGDIGSFLQDMAHEGSSPFHGGNLQTGSADPRILSLLGLQGMGGKVPKAVETIEAAWQPLKQLLYHGASTDNPLVSGAINDGGLYLASSRKAADKAAQKAVTKFGGDPVTHSILADPSAMQDSSYMWGYPGGATRAYVAKDPSALQLQKDGRVQAFKDGGTVDLDNMSHSDLYQMRDAMPNAADQSNLAPYEHQAFARESVGDNPLMALPIAAATPLYTAAKALGLVHSRSPASLEEIIKAYKGIGQGLNNWRSSTF